MHEKLDLNVWDYSVKFIWDYGVLNPMPNELRARNKKHNGLVPSS